MKMSLNKLLIHLAYFYFNFYFLDVYFDTFLEMGNIIWNVFYAIFKWNNFMSFMFIIAINTMNTKNFIFSLTVET